MRKLVSLLSLLVVFSLAVSAANTAITADLFTAKPAGIYVVTGVTVTHITPTAVGEQGVSMKPSFKMSSAVKAKLKGSKASTHAEPAAEFVFVGADFRPSSITLIELDQKDDKREFVTATGGMRGVKIGFDKKATIAYESVALGDNLHKITPSSPLKPGKEYAFVRASLTEAYPFGVYAAAERANNQ